MRYIKYIILIWSILQGSLAQAQQYPVEVQTFVTLPYPQQLRSYWDTFENKIQTQLLLKDLSSPMRNVTLHFSLENLQGQVIAQTASYALPFQTQLTAGVRKTLSNLDFKAVFALENLSGISENFYNDLLPEGTYFFCFTVYDITTQTPISNKSRAMVQIRRYTPPLLTLPARGEIIPKRNNFQHIVFQWAMRDPAPFTQYEFTLKEVWDNSLAPDEAFLSGRLIYQGNVSSNTLLYGNDKPFLLENKRYAWRVRAFTNNPNNPNQTASLFKNNGESETFVFDYIANCDAPKFLIASPQANTANIRWQSGGSPQTINTNGSLYKVLYREKGKAWKSVSASMPNATLSGLKRGKNYIYKVGIACGLDNPLNNSAFNEQTYLYSTEQEFTTTDRISDSLSVQCGVKPQIRIKNREPLQEVLGVNETFTAGDFPITVLSATGSNGVFSGVGYVQVPYLADTKIKVTFDNIKINSERQLFDGKIVTTYDKTEKNVVDISKEIEAIKEIFNETFDKITKAIQDGANANSYINIWKEALNDPQNNYTEEQKTAIKEHISDKKAIKKLIKAARQKIEKEGISNEEIKEHLASNFVGKQANKIQEDIADIFSIADYQVTFDKSLEKQPYKFYISPAGRLVILPSEAVPFFEEKIKEYDKITIPKGALTGFILHNQKYESEFIKKDGKWWFNGYVVCKEKREGDTCKRGIYYYSNEELKHIEERIANKDKSVLKELGVKEFSAIPLIIGSTTTIESIAVKGALRTGGSVLLRGATLYRLSFLGIIWGLFVTPSYIPETVGEGYLVDTLPIDYISYVEAPPKTIPVTIPHNLPYSSGKCAVYVIWKTHFLGNVTVAKYGKTCQENFLTKPECNPRPEYQVNYFNLQNDGYTYNYSWIITGVSNEIAILVERSMTALYILNNKGELPSHHKRPCFKEGDAFDIEAILERIKRAQEHLNNQK